jgi:hypothetical protein
MITRHNVTTRLDDALEDRVQAVRGGSRPAVGVMLEHPTAHDAQPSANVRGRAFEHICSPEEERAGRQEELYRAVFARIASLMPDRGRFHLQTVTLKLQLLPRLLTTAISDSPSPRE